jgi:phosphatidylglycerophosphatase A
MMRAIVIFLATGAYAGLVPVAPGTAGSVVGLVLAWLLLGYAGTHYWIVAAAFAGAFVLGCWIAQWAETILGEHDSSRIVLDEVMGMIATMFLNPLDRMHLLIGFALFRLFDILKLFPASLIDRRVPGGVGVMLDDLASAVYANIALRLVARLI